jgi:hypothetical protein
VAQLGRCIDSVRMCGHSLVVHQRVVLEVPGSNSAPPQSSADPYLKVGCHLGWYLAVCCPPRGGTGRKLTTRGPQNYLYIQWLYPVKDILDCTACIN